MSEVDWVFVAASALVEFLGHKAKQAPTWWPYISKSRAMAGPEKAILSEVTPRNEFMPLLHLAMSPQGDLRVYNPDGLGQSKLSILVPPSVVGEIDTYRLEMARIKEERTRKIMLAAVAKAQQEADRTKRKKVRKSLVAHLTSLASKYEVDEEQLLDAENVPTRLFHALEKLGSGTLFDNDEMLALRKGKFPYLAAAVHWRAWEKSVDPWNVIHTCSLLRRAQHPRKAVKLLSQIDISEWSGAVSSAFFTTLGGAQRDAGAVKEAWDSAKTALLKRDDKPHPYLLLGALCYQLDRREEGDDFFAKARARGATEKDIEFTRRDAESRRRNAGADDIDENF